MTEKEQQVPLLYTDLAMETAEGLGAGETSLPGVRVDTEEREITGGSVKITTVTIETDEGAAAIGKPIGSYITLESAAMKSGDILTHEEIILVFADKLSLLPRIKEAKSALIVGLGNEHVTPDALGPRVASKVLVTRFLTLDTHNVMDNLLPVCVISPGVLGTTGIETGDIIKGIVDHVKPGVIIAVDALAARNAARVNTTIQFADTGLSPGSGMGTGRTAINEQNLGVPVIAVGVPTVISAATLVNGSIDLMISDMIKETEEGSDFYNMLKNLGEAERYSLIKRLLDPYIGSMFVTPKDVDAVIDRLSNIIANALNIVLHPGVEREDINRFMY